MCGVAHLRAVVAVSCISVALARNILLTNDDGWAVAQIRVQYQELTDAGFDVCCNLSMFVSMLTFDIHIGHLVVPSREHVRHWFIDCCSYHPRRDLRV